MKRSVAFTTLVIGPGGGRDLLTALVFGAGRVDGVEVNPIIANDVMLGTVPRFLRARSTQNPKVQRRRRRRAQLHPAIERALRRDSGVARRHLGGHGRRRVHADREHAVHERSVRGLLRSPDRARRADDYALGVRRPAARVARAGGVRKPRMFGRRSHGHRAAGSRRDVSVEEVGVHRRRCRASARDVEQPRLYGAVCAGTNRHQQRLREARPRAGPAGVLRRLPSRRLADDRQPPVLFPHDENQGSVSDRVRPQHAVRQRPERADDADGDLGDVRHAVRCRPARCCRAASCAAATGRAGSDTSACWAPASCSSRWRCCSGSCCCSAIRSTR